MAHLSPPEVKSSSLSFLDASIAPLVSPLLEHGFEISPLDERIGDRFSIRAPYCLSFIEWEVMFGRHGREMPPDLIFSDIQISSSIRYGELQSAIQWDGENPDALLALAVEVLEYYKNSQKQVVADLNDPKLSFELEYAVTLPGMECMISNEEDFKEIVFLIPLSIDALRKYRDCDSVKLMLRYRLHRPELSMTKLVCPNSLRWLEDCRLGFWHSDTVLVEYLPNAMSTVENYINETRNRKESVGRFMKSLVKYFGHPLEVNEPYSNFLRMLFTAEYDNLAILIEITIPRGFPRDPISCSLQSSEHFFHNRNDPFVSRVANLPWNMRMNVDEIALHIREHIVRAFPAFKRSAVDSSRPRVMMGGYPYS